MKQRGRCDVRNLRNEKASSGGKKRGTSEIKEVDGNEKKKGEEEGDGA